MKALIQKKKITDNSNFWQPIVSLFTKKASKGEKIILNEEEKHISGDKKICTIFNNFFSNVLSYVTVAIIFPKKSTYFHSALIEAFANHPSILNIKERNLDLVFYYSEVGIESYSGFKH